MSGMVVSALARHRSKPHVYIGCMKSGLVLSQKWEKLSFSSPSSCLKDASWGFPAIICRGNKYREPEFWKFGEEGNKYFRHATGQIYAISKDLATYISVNKWALDFLPFVYNIDGRIVG